MSRGWFSILCLVGCSERLAPPADDELDARLEALLAAPTLSTTPWLAGATATVTVDGLTAGETAYVVGSGGTGSLPCPARAGGLCLDLQSGYRLLGSPVADGAGVASLELTAPVNPGRTVALQALVVRSSGAVKSDVVAVTVGEDADGDGHEASVDCDDGDPAVHPGADEICDGVDDDCDPSTVETGLVTADGAVAYPTIADALLHTAPGGVIDICDGVYTGLLTLPNAITLRGRGPGVTILDGGRAGTVLTIEEPAVIEDLTITGGSTTTQDGGGVRILTDSAELRRVEVVGNHTSHDGGGIYAEYTDLVLEDVTLTGNDANLTGGAIYLYNAHGLVGTRVAIIHNSSRQDGGGVYLWSSSLVCDDCELAENTANRGAGVFAASSLSYVELSGGAVVDNVAAAQGGGIYVSDGDLVTDGLDLGLGPTENTPDDVASSSFSIGFYGANITVTCDRFGC